MRIQELSAEWFRGAADTIALNTDNKSVVVYGPNGSGKSTFVDGLEYLLCSGKIAHLGHEYSGRRLENAIINTHCPAGASRRFTVKLDGGFEVVAELAANGAARFLGNDALEGWEKGWSILRQDEVSAFVHSSKGDKYSALLPLLGLEPIENVAANLRSIGNRVKEEAGLERLRAQLTQLTQEWDAAFPGVATTSVGGLIKDLHRKYLPEQEVPPTLAETLAALRRSISERIAGLDAEGACHFHLKVAHEADLRSRLSEAVTASDHAAKLAEPLLEERLAVLRSAAMFGGKLADEGLIHCPACGREIDANEFKEHVSLEATRLEGALKAFESRRLAFGRLASALVTATAALSRKEVANWRLAPEQAPVSKNLEALLSFDAERLREGVATPELERLRENLHPLAAHLEQSVKAVPPSVEQVVADQRMVNAAASHATRRACASKITVVEGLLAFLGQVEAEVRTEIRQRTEVLIDSISADLRRMWLLLHPDEAVDEVRLYQPDGNKAIDIALRFHGKNQLSPRLTLSEGHRNSLGLCIFFALAKKGGQNFPLVLDDVVTSFDREHRSFVADLLMQEFSDTQVLLLTHDHDWYVELKRRLPGNRWITKALLPWSDPATGIRWDGKPHGLGASRVLVEVDAMAAANRARAVMDVEMAVIAERLAIPIPFIRGARNDLRGALDLVQRFRSRAQGRFKKRNAQNNYEGWSNPTDLAKAAEDWLVTYGNAGSHGRVLTNLEAGRLIDACDAFLSAFECASCKTTVWHATDTGRTHLRCDCGEIRWNL